MNKTLNKRLASIYYDPKDAAGFSSIDKLLRAAKARGWSDVSRSVVSKWLSSQTTYSIHKPRRVNFRRARIFTYGLGYLMAADLAQFDSISRYNSGINFLLFIIDTFSKKLHIYPLKRKTASLVAATFDKHFEKNGSPLFLTSDLGSEFFNYELTKVLNKYGVHQFPARNKVKSPIVERVIRTVKAKIYRIMTKFNTRRFIDYLDDIEASYNNSWHRSIKMTPNKVSFDNAAIVFQNLYPKYYENLFGRIKFQFGVDDRVRIAAKQKIFDKAYKPHFSKEIYTVSKMFPTHPPRYAIRDSDGDEIAGTWYGVEMQIVENEEK